jgi:phosphatidylglycerophosphatase A
LLPFIHFSDLPVEVFFAEPAIVLASWFGAGLVEPLRAGLAVASVWPLAVVLGARSPVVLLALACVIAVAGAWAANAWEALLAIKDDRRIVIDEVAGYLAGMAVIGRAGWLGGGAFAALFLALDRLKPFPFDRIEGFPGGIGVMLDDTAVGLALGLSVMLGIAAWRKMSGSGVSP